MKKKKLCWAERRFASNRPIIHHTPTRQQIAAKADRDKAYYAALADNDRLAEIVGCAIMYKGELLGKEVQCRSHAEVRRHHGFEDPYTPARGEQQGYLTSTGGFVTRHEASMIMAENGQCNPIYGRTDILSCDVGRWGEFNLTKGAN